MVSTNSSICVIRFSRDFYHVDVVRTLGAGWRFVSALPGTRFDVEDSDMAVLVTIR